MDEQQSNEQGKPAADGVGFSSVKDAAEEHRRHAERRAREDEAVLGKPGRYDTRAIFFDEGAKLYDPHPRTISVDALTLEDVWKTDKPSGDEVLGEFTEEEYRAFARATVLRLNASNYALLIESANRVAESHRTLAVDSVKSRIGGSWSVGFHSGLIRRERGGGGAVADLIFTLLRR
jgi:hypothetical protein